MPDSVCLGDSEVTTTTVLPYLGLLIGSLIKNTQKLLLWTAEHKLRIVYASVVTLQLNQEQIALSLIYNSVHFLHILYLTLFWGIFTEFDG